METPRQQKQPPPQAAKSETPRQKKDASPQSSPRNSGGATGSGEPAYAPTPRGVLSNKLRKKWGDQAEDDDMEPQYVEPPQADDDKEAFWFSVYNKVPSTVEKHSFYNLFGRQRAPSRSPSPRHIPVATPQAQTVTSMTIGEGVELPPKRPLNSPTTAEVLPKRRAPGAPGAPAQPPSTGLTTPPKAPFRVPPANIATGAEEVIYKPPPPPKAPVAKKGDEVRPPPPPKAPTAKKDDKDDDEVPPPPAPRVVVKEELPPTPPARWLEPQAHAVPPAPPSPQVPFLPLSAKAGGRPVQPPPEVPNLVLPSPKGSAYSGPQASTAQTSESDPPPQAVADVDDEVLDSVDLLPGLNDPLPRSIERWVRNHMGFSLQAHRRIATLFFRAGFDPEQHIEKCSPVPLGDKMWARLVFKPGHAQQPTAIAPGDPETHYRHVGGHCTDSTGALCMLQERRVRRMHHAGVYCQGHNDIKHFEALKWIMGKAAGISKNVTDVMMEIHAVGATVSVRGGGVPEEGRLLREGHIIHSVNGHRWAFPEELVLFRAVWLCEDSIEDVYTVQIDEI